MALSAVRHVFTGPTTPHTVYDPDKTVLGPLLAQKTGVAATDKWAGPRPIVHGRPMETITPQTALNVVAVPFSDTVDWVFCGDGASAAATRRLAMWELDKDTDTLSFIGAITVTFPTITSHTLRSFRVLVENYITGTVAVSGTAVTGSGTAWQTDRMCVGSRIGFGSTDPAQITTWYEISAIGSDTGITLTGSAGTITAGTDYVIQDMRAVIATTNATAANGGLFVVKGLRPELFNNGPTVIPAATTVDNIRAVYWLADAGVVTNTVAVSTAVDDRADWQTHDVYVVNGTTSLICYKYNLRAALSGLASGKSTSALVLITGTQAVTGTTAGTQQNGRISTAGHGPGVGVKCIYFVTTTRMYRAALSGIIAASTTWMADAMSEVPPGGANTFAITGAFASCDYSDSLDRFIVFSTGAGGIRSYVTKYNTVADPFDHIGFIEARAYSSTSVDPDATIFPSVTGATLNGWTEGGRLYLVRYSTSNLVDALFVLPLGAHCDYAETTGNRLITPKMATPQCKSYYNVAVNRAGVLGNFNFGFDCDEFRTYYRTSGIDDNSGAWTLLDATGDLSAVPAATHIQFMFDFKVIGGTFICARLHNVIVVYEDSSTDSHYEPSQGQSSIVLRHFAYRQKLAFGSDIPDLRIQLYNASTGSLVLEDTVLGSSFGVWEYSTDDGASWLPWDDTQDLAGNYIRYTATAVAAVPIRALLTVA